MFLAVELFRNSLSVNLKFKKLSCFEIIKFQFILAILIALIYLLVDLLNSSKKPWVKMVWIMAMTFLPIIGMSVYFYFCKKESRLMLFFKKFANSL
jgi:hypothetical protein